MYSKELKITSILKGTKELNKIDVKKNMTSSTKFSTKFKYQAKGEE